MPPSIQPLFHPDNFKPPRHPSKSSMKKDQTFWTALSKMESWCPDFRLPSPPISLPGTGTSFGQSALSVISSAYRHWQRTVMKWKQWRMTTMTTFLPKHFLSVILITQDSTGDTDDKIFHLQCIKSSPWYSAPAAESLHCVSLMSQCHLIYSCCCDPPIAICLPYLQGLMSSKHSRDSLKGIFERQNDAICFVISLL